MVLKTSSNPSRCPLEGAVELVVADHEDLPAGCRSEPLQPTARETPDRDVAQDHDRVVGFYYASPCSEQGVVHLIGGLVGSAEDADRHGVAEVEIAPQPHLRVVLLVELTRLACALMQRAVARSPGVPLIRDRGCRCRTEAASRTRPSGLSAVALGAHCLRLRTAFVAVMSLTPMCSAIARNGTGHGCPLDPQCSVPWSRSHPVARVIWRRREVRLAPARFVSRTPSCPADNRTSAVRVSRKRAFSPARFRVASSRW